MKDSKHSRIKRLEKIPNRKKLDAVFYPNPSVLAEPYYSGVERWEFKNFHDWIVKLNKVSGQVAIRAAYGMANSTLNVWHRFEKEKPDLAKKSVYVCSPAHKMQVIGKYLSEPNIETLKSLIPLADFTVQTRWIHKEYESGWFTDAGKVMWCIEAVEFCLTTLLYYVIGPYYEFEDASNEYSMCAEASINCLRGAKSESVVPVMEILVASIKEQLQEQYLSIPIRAVNTDYHPSSWRD